ncbi:hypothetical protein CISIN_1g041790mg, partial [Citrus sinensis]
MGISIANVELPYLTSFEIVFNDADWMASPSNPCSMRPLLLPLATLTTNDFVGVIGSYSISATFSLRKLCVEPLSMSTSN